jgi:hypothetical protein
MSDIIHIGFPKTGSTALRRHLFPSLPHHTYLGLGGAGSNRQEIFRLLMQNLCHSDDSEYLGRTFRAFVRAAREPGRTDLLISQPALAGAVERGGYNRTRNAHRLQELLPEAKILIVVRDQLTMLRSIYSSYIQRGGYVSLGDFLANRAEGWHLDLDHLCYDSLVRQYHDLFGVDHVKVITYEKLQSSPEAFLLEVLAFLTSEAVELRRLPSLTRSNRSLSRPSRWVVRQNNRLFRRSTFSRRPRFPSARIACRVLEEISGLIDAHVPADARQLSPTEEALLTRLASRYQEANAHLELLTGVRIGEERSPAQSRSCSAI